LKLDDVPELKEQSWCDRQKAAAQNSLACAVPEFRWTLLLAR
jgi:hypothetical protein